MPSLYAHEHLSKDYSDRVEFPDTRLLATSQELISMLEITEVPRQRHVINTLLGRLSFEVGCRMTENNDGLAQTAEA